jgi:hypothetical protein
LEANWEPKVSTIEVISTAATSRIKNLIEKLDSRKEGGKEEEENSTFKIEEILKPLDALEL